MNHAVPGGEGAGECFLSKVRVGAPQPTHLAQPHQLSFLSSLPVGEGGRATQGDEDDADYIDSKGRLRRRPCLPLKESDVREANAVRRDERVPLRTPTGERLPPLYCSDPSGDHGGDSSHGCCSDSSSDGGDFRGASTHAIGQTFRPADAATIIASADALLAWRFRRGVKIYRDPFLLLRFLRIRLVSQPQPVFAVFFCDRKQRLLQFTEMFRGSEDRVAETGLRRWISTRWSA